MSRGTLLAILLWVGPAQADSPRRFLLAIGENLGDVDDEPLRFAAADARRFSEVMREVGAVRAEDGVALYTANAGEVRAAFARLLVRLRKEARPSDQLVVYFSSHADEGELHLRGTRLPLAALTALMREAPVGVGLLILDSCRSGAVTRLKGLKPAAGAATAEVQVSQVQGTVVLTASGADEYAQESDSLEGSYFTHHLVAGLRGAADSSHDGRVTLEEAYAYAYSRTIESTFATRGGLQRPSYHVDLRGQGELILSELRLGLARLSIDVEASSPWLISSVDGKSVVLSFEKGPGARELATRGRSG